VIPEVEFGRLRHQPAVDEPSRTPIEDKETDMTSKSKSRRLICICVVVLLIGAVAAAGCGSTTSGSGANSAGGGTDSSGQTATTQHVTFAKTKFLLHAGLAFGAFHRLWGIHLTGLECGGGGRGWQALSQVAWRVPGVVSE